MILSAAILSNGEVHTGASHADIIQAQARQGIDVLNGIRGFVTYDGRFLTRAEAMVHARECGQLKRAPMDPNNLHSEDLI